MQMSPYLNFRGDCEAAFSLYERCLGAQVGAIFRYAGTPMAGDVAADWSNKVMHGSVSVGGQLLQGCDLPPDRYVEPKGFSLSIQPESTAEAERIFAELAADGTVVMALERTFWAARFGMVVDRFGIPWLINCEAPDPVPEG